MSQMVTGEAVELDLRPASFASRAVSGFIDVFVQAVVLIGLVYAVARLGASLDAAAAAALNLTIVVLVLVGIPMLTETLTRGRTLGKLVMGLRTVRDDGGPIRLRHAFVRALLEIVDVVPFGGPALISSLASPTGKRIGDLLAGTYVVRERGAVKAAPPALMPPALEGWARHADIARLPDGLALSVRQMLGRSAQLHPRSRHELGLELARAVAPHVAPPPPAGTHPEAFLAAVLAERRTRDLARLARERQTRERQAGVASIDAALARVRTQG
ncbi:MAG TPA: RDD family protein [Actinomycetales bacterium]|jgi:uncharacterized RDD family membrane protein YckC